MVLDSNGKVAAEDTTVGFTEEVIRQIREYIRRQNAAKEIPARAAATPSLENWQKSYENGEYLRSAEMAEEQNYSMIDGRMNNMPSKGPVHQRPAGKRRKGKLPMKGRESVLKRLKEYQDELAAQRGQAVVSSNLMRSTTGASGGTGTPKVSLAETRRSQNPVSMEMGVQISPCT